MRRLFLILILLMCVALPVAAQGNQPPAEMTYALSGLSTALNRPISFSQLSSWSYTADRYDNTALGCPGVTGQPRPETIVGYSFDLVLAGVTYNIRVTPDGSIIIPCVIPNVSPIVITPGPTPGPGTPVVLPANQVELEYTPCPPNPPGFLPPRLTVGQQTRVPIGNTPNRLRNAPNTGAIQIGVFNTGGTADVIAGPACDSVAQIVWWLVNYNGTFGWTAEGALPNDYYLDPVASPASTSIVDVPVFGTGVTLPTTGQQVSTVALPDERTAINPSNVTGLSAISGLSSGSVREVAFSPEGLNLAVASNTGLSVFELPDLTINESVAVVGDTTSVAFNGLQLIYSSLAGELFLTNLTDGAIIPFAAVPSEGVNSLSVSTPNRMAVAGGAIFGGSGEESVEIFDLFTRQVVTTIPADFWVTNVAYNPTRTRLAFIDTSLNIYNAAGTTEQSSRAIEGGSLGALAWRPNTTDAQDQIAFGDGNTIRILTLATNTEQVIEVDAQRTVKFLAYSPDASLLFAVSDDSGIERPASLSTLLSVFDTETGDLLFETEIAQPNVSDVRSITVSPDGTLLVIGSSTGVTIYGVQ